MTQRQRVKDAIRHKTADFTPHRLDLTQAVHEKLAKHYSDTFQPEIYDLKKFNLEYGNDITIYGGISTHGVLSQGTPEQVYDTTIKSVEILGKNDGYIAAPTHQCTNDIPVENFLAFLNAVQRY